MNNEIWTKKTLLFVTFLIGYCLSYSILFISDGAYIFFPAAIIFGFVILIKSEVLNKIKIFLWSSSFLLIYILLTVSSFFLMFEQWRNQHFDVFNPILFFELFIVYPLCEFVFIKLKPINGWFKNTLIRFFIIWLGVQISMFLMYLIPLFSFSKMSFRELTFELNAFGIPLNEFDRTDLDLLCLIGFFQIIEMFAYCLIRFRNSGNNPILKNIVIRAFCLIGLILCVFNLKIPRSSFEMLSDHLFCFSISGYIQSNYPDDNFSSKNLLVEFAPFATNEIKYEIISSLGRARATGLQNQYFVKLKPGLEAVVVADSLYKTDEVEGAEPALEDYPNMIHKVYVTFKPSTPRELKLKIIEAFGNIDKSISLDSDSYTISLKGNLVAGKVVKQLMKQSIVEKAFPIFPSGHC